VTRQRQRNKRLMFLITVVLLSTKGLKPKVYYVAILYIPVIRLLQRGSYARRGGPKVEAEQPNVEARSPEAG